MNSLHGSPIRCTEAEVLVADYIDHTLGAQDRAALKAHLNDCAACRQLADDAASIVELAERSAVLEPPPELINKILFEIGNGAAEVRAPWWMRVFGRDVRPLWQPRFVMGMAMTMLSFGMLLRVAGVRDWQDLRPANAAAAVEDRAARLWDRGVQKYETLPVVAAIRTSYDQWSAQQAPPAGTQEPDARQ